MARDPRLAVAGELHYLMQRGHSDQSVFVDDVDRESFLDMLRDSALQHDVQIHAYALLSSEVHLLATPGGAQSLSRLMQSLGRRFGAHFNRRHGRTGSVWSGRFRAGIVDGSTWGIEALVHVESLPLRAGLATQDSVWPWSSASHHLGRRRDPLITEHPAYWATGNTPFERELAHADRLRDGLPMALHEKLELVVTRGRALGSPGFCQRVSPDRDLSLRPRPRGRPPKARNSYKSVPD